jgi:hypothetical protein
MEECGKSTSTTSTDNKEFYICEVILLKKMIQRCI